MHKHLKKLYVQNNFIKKYSPEFTEMVKAGLDVEYAGKCIKKGQEAAFNATFVKITHSTFQWFSQETHYTVTVSWGQYLIGWPPMVELKAATDLGKGPNAPLLHITKDFLSTAS